MRHYKSNNDQGQQRNITTAKVASLVQLRGADGRFDGSDAGNAQQVIAKGIDSMLSCH